MPTPASTSTHPGRDWITRKEAAAHLGVTERFIDKLTSRGQIKAYRLGTKTIRIDRFELDSLLHPIPTAGGDR